MIATAKARGRGVFQGGSSINVTYYITEVYVGDPNGLRFRANQLLREISRNQPALISLSFWNSTNETVTATINGRVVTFRPGAQVRMRERATNGIAVTVYVHNSGRTYSVKAGNHKFFPLSNRVGFFRNYDVRQ